VKKLKNAIAHKIRADDEAKNEQVSKELCVVKID
jgi:hypothetical protein